MVYDGTQSNLTFALIECVIVNSMFCCMAEAGQYILEEAANLLIQGMNGK